MNTSDRSKLDALLQLRAKVDGAIASEAAHLGQLQGTRPGTRRAAVRFVVLPAPTLAAAAADIVRWSGGR